MSAQVTYLGTSIAGWVGALSSSDPLQRRLGAYALGEIGPAASEAVPNLAAALEDPVGFVRVWAAAALAQVAPSGGESVTVLIAEIGQRACLRPQPSGLAPRPPGSGLPRDRPSPPPPSMASGRQGSERAGGGRAGAGDARRKGRPAAGVEVPVPGGDGPPRARSGRTASNCPANSRRRRVGCNRRYPRPGLPRFSGVPSLPTFRAMQIAQNQPEPLARS